MHFSRGWAKLTNILRVVSAEFSWHRELVRRKWTFRSRSKPGRPKIVPDLESLIVRLAKGNPRFGLGKLQGELKNWGLR